MTRVEPLRFAISVPLQPDHAFDLFTVRIDSWWPLGDFSVSRDEASTCVVEPFVGGRVYERSRSGDEHEWGVVIAFDRPRRFVATWNPGGGPQTEVEVTFTPADDGTSIELVHRGWEALAADAERVRDLYANGWPYVFVRRFAEKARRVA